MHYTTKSVSAGGLAFSIWPAYADGVATGKLDLNDNAEELAVVGRSAVYQKRRSGHNPPRDYSNINAAGQQHQNSLRRLPHRMRRRFKRKLLKRGICSKGALLDLEGDQTRPSVVSCYQIIQVILT